MALTKGPLFSIDASGQIAKTLVYGNWRGRQYARQHVVPKNPGSTAQMSTRNVMRFLVAAFRQMPANILSDLNAAGVGWGNISGINAWTKQNLPVLPAHTDMNNIIFMHGLNGGLSLASLASTPGSGSLAITVGLATLPSDWTYVRTDVVLLLDQDPHAVYASKWYETSLSGATVTHTFSSLGSSKKFQVGAYSVYTQPNGATAISPSTVIQSTTS